MDDFDLIECLTTKRSNYIFVWMFNIGTEKFWSNYHYTIKDEDEDIIVNHIEEMNFLLTRKQDFMILRKRPNREYLKDLESAGFDIPRILCPSVENENKSIAELVLDDQDLLVELTKLSKSNEKVHFVPYGVSHLEETIAERCQLSLIGAKSELNKIINNKVFSRNLANGLELPTTEGMICISIQEVEEAYKSLKQKYDRVIIKMPNGASGQGLFIVDNDSKMKSILLILKRFQQKHSDLEYIVEGWYEDKVDINYQVCVSKTGKITTFSIKEQIVKDTVYMGSIYPPRISKELYAKYIDYGNQIGNALFQFGFHGVLGIDSIIRSDNLVIPIIEINARFTLSSYISFLTSKCPNKVIYSFYKKIKLSNDLKYHVIKDAFNRNKISFDILNKNGVLLYTSETINSTINKSYGRAFIIVFADNLDEVDKYKEKIDEILQHLTNN